MYRYMSQVLSCLKTWKVSVGGCEHCHDVLGADDPKTIDTSPKEVNACTHAIGWSLLLTKSKIYTLFCHVDTITTHAHTRLCMCKYIHRTIFNKSQKKTFVYGRTDFSISPASQTDTTNVDIGE